MFGLAREGRLGVYKEAPGFCPGPVIKLYSISQWKKHVDDNADGICRQGSTLKICRSSVTMNVRFLCRSAPDEKHAQCFWA